MLSLHPTRPPVKPAPALPRKVAICDDDADIREALRDILQEEGYAVCEAKDGLDLLGVLHREQPDALLLDLMMPRVDGLEVLGTLQRLPKYQHLAIIVLSAADPDKVHLPGEVSRLQKPVDLQALLGTLRERLL